MASSSSKEDDRAVLDGIVKPKPATSKDSQRNGKNINEPSTHHEIDLDERTKLPTKPEGMLYAHPMRKLHSPPKAQSKARNGLLDELSDGRFTWQAALDVENLQNAIQTCLTEIPKQYASGPPKDEALQRISLLATAFDAADVSSSVNNVSSTLTGVVGILRAIEDYFADCHTDLKTEGEDVLNYMSGRRSVAVVRRG
ncbi:hypothetical protein NCC49_006592 [Naganishia albida]|nr:hypothetical protein NCC49_006592 [Naganishia albida]